MIKKMFKKYSLLTIVILVILVGYTVSLIYPLLWGFITSFKGTLDYISNPIGFPSRFAYENYLTAYQYFYLTIENGANTEYIYIEEMIMNSLLYAVGGAFFATFTAAITAYATARYNYVFSKIVYWIVIVTMILPIVGNLPSEIQVTKALGLYDSIFGLYILKANFLGLYYLVFYAMFKAIPKDYEDAAKIDGASNFQIFFRIMLPMAKKIFFTIMLIQFITFWNDYQTPLLYLPTKPTLAVGLFNYSTSTINAISSTPVKLAGALMVFIPIFIIFIFTQKRLMGGMQMGGLKE